MNRKHVILVATIIVLAASVYFFQERTPNRVPDGPLQSDLETESDTSASKQVKQSGNNKEPDQKASVSPPPKKGDRLQGETSRSGKINAQQAALLRKQLQQLFAQTATDSSSSGHAIDIFGLPSFPQRLHSKAIFSPLVSPIDTPAIHAGSV